MRAELIPENDQIRPVRRVRGAVSPTGIRREFRLLSLRVRCIVGQDAASREWRAPAQPATARPFEIYSYRSASKISVREALCAGHTPKMTPTTRDMRKAGGSIQSGARRSKEGTKKKIM